MLAKIRLFLFGLLIALWLILPFFGTEAGGRVAPNFEQHFADKLTKSDPQNKETWSERVFSIECVSSQKSIQENIECLFFPWKNNNGGYLWNILKYLGYILVFVYLVITASQLLFNAKKSEDLKTSLNTLLTIMIGSALYFGAIWLFGTVIQFNSINQTTGLRDNLLWASGILFFVLSFLKWAAFFYAIIMIVITWFQMMNPSSGEEGGGKKLVKNLSGIIAALLGMKVVDFIYFIASEKNFAEKAGNFIIDIAKFLAYVSGSVIVLMIIYSGYLLLIDGGKWENFKKAKTTLINILLAVMSLFFFLFLLYQIFAEFGK